MSATDNESGQGGLVNRHNETLVQCFSTFFGLKHPFWVKIFGGTLTLVNYYFEAPLKLIIDKFHSEQQENLIICGTPMTVMVENHCLTTTPTLLTDIRNVEICHQVVCKPVVSTLEHTPPIIFVLFCPF